MFIDRQKLERAYLDELTKIGNLFDTLNIDHCITGGYALLSYSISTRGPMDCKLLVFTDKRDKIIEMLFKLNYTICSINNNNIKITKEDPHGAMSIDLILGKQDDKFIVFNINNRDVKLGDKFFAQNRKEVKNRKGAKGFFRVAPLELIYFSKMNSTNETDLFDLEMIKNSSKMDIDKLLKLFEINGMM
jgi:hypothetical protein